MESYVDPINVSILKRYARDNLIVQLEEIHGKKDLIIDEELLRPLDRFAGVSVLKNHGVDKIFKLEAGIVQNCERRMYITRPYISRMRLIADHVKKDKEKGLMVDCRVIFTPKRLAICENFLEEEGVYGDISIDEFPLDFLVLDNDLLSLEMPLFYQDFYQNGDFTWISSLARTISTMQSTFGTIPQVACFGRGAKMVYDLLQILMSNEKDYTPLGGPEISSLIIFGREIDCITPLCSQLAYEGLLADVFGISSGFIDFGKEVTGLDKNTRVLLDSNDAVFQEVRDMHFTSVFPLLSRKAKQLQTGYDKRNDLRSVSEMKNFVSQDLKHLKQQHKSLTLHISACESILKKKTGENFEKLLRTEQSLLDDTDTKEAFDFVEECINRQLPPYNVLRLLCLVSQTRGASDVARLKSLKHQYLQSYGYEHIITFDNLAKAGLFNEGPEKKGQYQRFRKKMNLVPKNPTAINLKDPDDISYIFGGAYAPFSIKLIEQYLLRGLASVENVLKSDGISVFENRRPMSARASGSHTQPSVSAKKTILIVFFGGCTHSEISALRFISKKQGYQFMILTTGMATGISFVKPFSAT